MMDWLVNGVANRLVPADDRGLHYGDGLFETIAIRDGMLRLFDRHMARLADGCRRLGIAVQDEATIRAEIAQLAGRGVSGTAKVVVTRGPGPRGYQPPAQATPTRMIGFATAGAGTQTCPAPGLDVVICRTPASENGQLAGLKTLNRLDNVLARQEVADRGGDEGLMSDATGNVIGGTSSNLFVWMDGQLLTPSLVRCGVRGIMRGLVLEVVRGSGITVVETDIPLRSLADADEMFMTNALKGLRPVIEIEGRSLRAGPATATVGQILRNHGIRESVT
jgi:4-amino-4-deoxychorismate lyase